MCREVVPGLAPSAVNSSNFLAVEELVNANLWYPRPLPRGVDYLFHVNDVVLLKRQGLKDSRSLPLFGGVKKSLIGHDSNKAMIIAARRTKSTGRKGQMVGPFYAGKHCCAMLLI